mgnify:FL=1
MEKISIIIPAYQAEQIIESSIQQLIQHYSDQEQYEIIVVNDGSRDKTQEILEKYQKDIVVLTNKRNMGKGFSIKAGCQIAKGNYILFTDADLPYGIAAMDSMISKFNKETTAIVGERRIMHASCWRKITHWGFAFCERLILGIEFSDTQCGLKGFKAPILKEIRKISIINRFGFDVEIIYLLQKARIPIDFLEVPDANYNNSTIKLKDVIDMINELWKIKSHKYDLTNLKKVYE